MEDPRLTEKEFFAALLAGDAGRLEAVLAPDFVLVDVMQGGLISREVLVDLVGSSQLRFLSIETVEAETRLYGPTAVIVGRTKMRMAFSGQEGEASSRYTHVLYNTGKSWQLVSAQGTQIVE